MSKEREAFEIFYKSNESQYHKALDNYDTDFDCYLNDYIQCRYFYWQAAQAVPEGFAVVPIETLDEALSWANCAASESWTDAQREEIDKHYRVIEKAMIEARAVPEGFVLVEKDLIQSIHQSCNNALDINDRDIYKGLCMAIIDDAEAMIEAQHPSSTPVCPDEP